MLDVMHTIKEEILDDKLLGSCKDLVEKTGTQTTIVWVCNSKTATCHIMAIPTSMMYRARWSKVIASIARRCDADAILTVVTAADRVFGQPCMTITIETLLSRYTMVYPYERMGCQGGRHKVVWEEPRQVELQGHYGDLLPTPAGMAQA